MNMLVQLSRDDCQLLLPYMIIWETTSRAVWDTRKRRMRFKAAFSESEKKMVYEIILDARKMALRGISNEGLTMSTKKLCLWKRLADFCYEIG